MRLAGFDCERFISETALLRMLCSENFDLLVVDAARESLEEGGVYFWRNCRSGESTPVVFASPGFLRQDCIHTRIKESNCVTSTGLVM